MKYVRQRHATLGRAVILALLLLASLAGGGAYVQAQDGTPAAPTASPSPTGTGTRTPAATPSTRTPAAPPTATATPTDAPTDTPTATLAPQFTDTPVPTLTPDTRTSARVDRGDGDRRGIRLVAEHRR
ncbi:MAG: hypothetical protein M5R40_29615 [Anaerolineae bacterium]|nr:hypothetical protein [Anaerolineae bacterium]